MDQNAGPKFRDVIAKGTAKNEQAVLAKSVKCGWGEWSLVQATLNMIEAGVKAFPDATHFFLISGDCMPVKPAAHVHAALEPSDTDWIEHADFFEDNWIKTGLKEDRLVYRHWFNELSLIHISEPTRPERISYAVFCLKKKK